MLRWNVVVVLALVGCDAKRSEPPVDKPAPQVQAPADASTPDAVVVDAAPGPIQIFEVSDSPMTLTVAGSSLVWTDSAGSLWTMPARGGAAPIERTDQSMPGAPLYMEVITQGDQVIAADNSRLVRMSPVDGSRVPLVDLGEKQAILGIATDGAAIYGTVMDSPAIFKLAADGTRTTLLTHPRASIAVHADTLYSVSYANGTLLAIKTTGGSPRTLATGLQKPTGFTVDDKAAYVWSEGDRAVRRIDIGTRKATVIATDIGNGDWLVADGDWIYANDWSKSAFVRIAKDGSGTQILATGLRGLYGIATDADAVYVAVRDKGQILRFDKRAITPVQDQPVQK